MPKVGIGHEPACALRTLKESFLNWFIFHDLKNFENESTLSVNDSIESESDSKLYVSAILRNLRAILLANGHTEFVHFFQ